MWRIDNLSVQDSVNSGAAPGNGRYIDPVFISDTTCCSGAMTTNASLPYITPAASKDGKGVGNTGKYGF
jgi:hypothetical protein